MRREVKKRACVFLPIFHLMIRDAETGEVLTLTKSKWDAVEGRVNLDFRSIILMGTGAMSIKNAANGTGLSRGMLFDTTEDDEDIEGDEDLEERADDSPLFLKFMRDGPLNPMAHQRWNPKTGSADPDPRLAKEALRLEKQQRLRRRQEAAAEAIKQKLEQESAAELEEGDKQVAHSVLNLWRGGGSLCAGDPPPSVLVSGGARPQSPGQLSDSSISSHDLRRMSPSSAARSRSRSRQGRYTGRNTGSAHGRRGTSRDSDRKDSTSVFSLLSGDEGEGERDSQSWGTGGLAGSAKQQGGQSLQQGQQVFFNELFLKAAQIDRIRHPLPPLHDKSLAERDRTTAQDDERRLQLVQRCGELA